MNKNLLLIGYRTSFQLLIFIFLLILLDHFKIIVADYYLINLKIVSFILVLIYSIISYLRWKDGSFKKLEMTRKIWLGLFYLLIFILFLDTLVQSIFIGNYDYFIYYLIISFGVLINLINPDISNKNNNNDKEKQDNSKHEEDKNKINLENKLENNHTLETKIKNKSLKSDEIKTYRKYFYYFLIALILLLSFYLRISNLNIIDPYTDEYYHLDAAKQYLEYGTFDYERAKIVTWLSIFLIWISGASSFDQMVFWARFGAVFFGLITTFMIYLLGKRIKKSIGIVSALLWAISPWAIGLSRTVREYAYYPFFILLGIWLLLKYSDKIKSFEDIFAKKNLPLLIINLFYLVLFIIYSIFIDSDSTLKIGLLIFAVTLIYMALSKFSLLYHFYKHHETLITILTIILIFAISIGAYFAVTINQQTSLEKIEFEKSWSQIFLDSHRSEKPMQWWDKLKGTTYLIPFLIFLALAIQLSNRKFEILNYFLIFTILLIFYSFFFDRYFKPRYISHLLPIFVILIGSGIYSLYQPLTKFKAPVSKYLLSIIPTIFLLSILSFSALSFNQTVPQMNEVLNSTGEYHDEVKITLLYPYENIFDKSTIIISGTPQIMGFIFDIKRENNYHYYYDNETRFDFTKNIMKNNPSGYIVIDERRNIKFAKGFEIGNFTYEIDRNTYSDVRLIQEGHWFVYKWEIKRK